MPTQPIANNVGLVPVNAPTTAAKANIGTAVAGAMSAVTVALGLIPDHTNRVWVILTVLSGVLTAVATYLGIYLPSNKPLIVPVTPSATVDVAPAAPDAVIVDPPADYPDVTIEPASAP